MRLECHLQHMMPARIVMSIRNTPIMRTRLSRVRHVFHSRPVMQVAKVLPCGHVFHLTCLTSWMQQSGTDNFTCPLCRMPLFSHAPGQNTGIPLMHFSSLQFTLSSSCLSDLHSPYITLPNAWPMEESSCITSDAFDLHLFQCMWVWISRVPQLKARDLSRFRYLLCWGLISELM